MNILEIIPSVEAGGAEVFLVNLCNEMCRHKDVKITILTFKNCTDCFLLRKLNPRVTVQTIPKRNGVDISLIFKLKHFIDKGDYDIAHFHVNAIAYALYVSASCECRCFATIHNDAYREASGIHRLIRRILFRMGWVHPITISHQSDSSFKRLYKQQSTIIYNGIPAHYPTKGFSLDEYRLTDNTRILLSAASMFPVKNELSVARAVQQLINDGEDIVYIMVGRNIDNEYVEEIKNICSERIHYLGEVPNPVDYMKSSDFFVLASHFEGLPISLLEAVSVGCVPIVTPVGGCADVVSDGQNGFIIKSQDETEIYTILKRVLEIPKAKLADIQNQGIKDSQLYTIENCANSYIELFNN